MSKFFKYIKNIEMISLLTESSNTFTYNLPENRQKRLFDFYTFSSLSPIVNDLQSSEIKSTKSFTSEGEEQVSYRGLRKLNANFVDSFWKANDKCYIELAKEMLMDIFYCISAEFKYIKQDSNYRDTNRIPENLRQIYQYYLSDETEYASIDVPIKKGEENNTEYNRRYEKVIKSVVLAGKSIYDFAELCSYVYDNFKFTQYFGGPNWADAANAFLEIANAIPNRYRPDYIYKPVKSSNLEKSLEEKEKNTDTETPEQETPEEETPEEETPEEETSEEDNQQTASFYISTFIIEPYNPKTGGEDELDKISKIKSTEYLKYYKFLNSYNNYVYNSVGKLSDNLSSSKLGFLFNNIKLMLTGIININSNSNFTQKFGYNIIIEELTSYIIIYNDYIKIIREDIYHLTNEMYLDYFDTIENLLNQNKDILKPINEALKNKRKNNNSDTDNELEEREKDISYRDEKENDNSDTEEAAEEETKDNTEEEINTESSSLSYELTDKERTKLFIAIDHTWGLSHNTGPTFNKLESFNKLSNDGKGEWLIKALDKRTKDENLYRFIDEQDSAKSYVSQQMIPIIRRVIYSYYGATNKEELYKYVAKTNPVKEVPFHVSDMVYRNILLSYDFLRSNNPYIVFSEPSFKSYYGKWCTIIHPFVCFNKKYSMVFHFNSYSISSLITDKKNYTFNEEGIKSPGNYLKTRKNINNIDGITKVLDIKNNLLNKFVENGYKAEFFIDQITDNFKQIKKKTNIEDILLKRILYYWYNDQEDKKIKLGDNNELNLIGKTSTISFIGSGSSEEEEEEDKGYYGTPDSEEYFRDKRKKPKRKKEPTKIKFSLNSNPEVKFVVDFADEDEVDISKSIKDHILKIKKEDNAGLTSLQKSLLSDFNMGALFDTKTNTINKKDEEILRYLNSKYKNLFDKTESRPDEFIFYSDKHPYYFVVYVDKGRLVNPYGVVLQKGDESITETPYKYNDINYIVSNINNILDSLILDIKYQEKQEFNETYKTYSKNDVTEVLDYLNVTSINPNFTSIGVSKDSSDAIKFKNLIKKIITEELTNKYKIGKLHLFTNTLFMIIINHTPSWVGDNIVYDDLIDYEYYHSYDSFSNQGSYYVILKLKTPLKEKKIEIIIYPDTYNSIGVKLSVGSFTTSIVTDDNFSEVIKILRNEMKTYFFEEDPFEIKQTEAPTEKNEIKESYKKYIIENFKNVDAYYCTHYFNKLVNMLYNLDDLVPNFNKLTYVFDYIDNEIKKDLADIQYLESATKTNISGYEKIVLTYKKQFNFQIVIEIPLISNLRIHIACYDYSFNYPAIINSFYINLDNYENKKEMAKLINDKFEEYKKKYSNQLNDSFDIKKILKSFLLTS